MDLKDWHKRYLQQARWTHSVRRHLFNQFHVPAGPGLEIGSGTGAITSDLHEMTPTQLYGVDIDRAASRFAAGFDPRTRFIQANGFRLPFKRNVFSFSCCHYLLLWLSNPLDLLLEMRRVTKKKGLVLIFAEPDYGGRVDYPETLSALGARQRSALRQQGTDPDMGRKLARLMSAAGFHAYQVAVMGGEWQFPSNRAPNSLSLEWAITREDLSETLTREQMEAYYNIEKEAHEKGERILYVPTFYAWAEND